MSIQTPRAVPVFCSKCGQQQWEHGQAILCPHQVVISKMNELTECTDQLCNGATWWDDALEGIVCSKCNLYTGSK